MVTRMMAAGATALGLLSLMAPGAEAKPADCLFGVSGKPLFEGTCDFETTDDQGSFRLTMDGATAEVKVWPDGGQAFFENFSLPGEKGSFTAGDVARKGACWQNKDVKICAWAAGTRPGQPKGTPAPQARGEAIGDLYRFPYANLPPWEILRYTTDRPGKQTAFCGATEIVGSEQALRFLIGTEGSNFGFMGYATSALGPSVPIFMWFGGEGERANGHRITGLLDTDPDGLEWLSVDPATKPDLSSFGLYGTVNFAYQVDGQEHVQSYPLTGAGAALTQLESCLKR